MYQHVKDRANLTQSQACLSYAEVQPIFEAKPQRALGILISECKCTDKKIPDYAKKARRESIGEEKKNIGKESGKNPIIFLSYDVCLRIVCLRLYACPTRFCRHREKSSLGIFLASCRSSF